MIQEQSPSLVLNQSSLQDFLECPRRFELGTLDAAPWPDAPSAPLSKYELLTEIGTRFHQLCQQLFIGIDPDLITTSISDPDLLQLWQTFLPYGKSLLVYKTFPEQILRIPFQDVFLVAKYDLIVQISEAEFLIIDWKTSAQKPDKSILANRVQTFLYPFIFHGAGGDLWSIDSIPCSAIKMQYWFPQSSEPEELFPYSDQEHDKVSQMISGLVAQIHELINAGSHFPLTEDHNRCKYCVYRSFCERGNQATSIPAGADLEHEDLSNAHFDMDLIKEIEF